MAREEALLYPLFNECVCVCVISDPWRPEEGAGSPRSGITGGSGVGGKSVVMRQT